VHQPTTASSHASLSDPDAQSSPSHAPQTSSDENGHAAAASKSKSKSRLDRRADLSLDLDLSLRAASGLRPAAVPPDPLHQSSS
jgi:hypothetical protein